MAHLTMAQLAAKAGVCKATVSLALRHDPRISAGTIRRVQELAKRLGYTRNPVLDELMSELRRSRGAAYKRTIALLNAHPQRRALLDHPTVPVWVEGCRRRAAYLGYTTDEFWLHDPELDAPRLGRILHARGIRGAIVLGAFVPESLPERFAALWPEVTTVLTGIRSRRPALPFTCVDHHNLVRDAVARLSDLGYTRPGLVVYRHVDIVTDSRFSCAMWLAQQARPEADRVPTLVPEDQASAEASFRTWFAAHRPDAVLTVHTQVREWLAAMKVAVPRDVGLVHLERNRFTADWAGMDQHNDVAGEAAVEMLVGLLQNKELGIPAFPRATLIGATWADGATVRRRRARTRRRVRPGRP